MAFATMTVDLNASIAKFEQDLQRAVSESKKATNQIKGAFDSVKEAIGLFGVGLGIKELFGEIISRTIDMQRSQAQLASTLRATGHAAGLTSDELEHMGHALSGSTAFDDDDIRKAQVTLLRFRDIQGGVFKDAIKATLDYATAQRSTASEAAGVLGKALEDPLHSMKALKDVGIILNQGQKDSIQAFLDVGNAAGAQKIVLDALKASIGGGAEGENTGLYGSTRSLAKAWDDLLKALGESKAVGGVLKDSIDFVSQGLKDLDSDVEQFSGADTFTKKWTAAFRAWGGLDDEMRKKLFIPEVVGPTDKGERDKSARERDAAEAGKANQDALRNAEAARVKALEGLHTRVALASANMQKEIAIEQQTASTKLSILDSYYNRGLIATVDFYAARSAAAKDAAVADVESINKVIKVQQELLANKSTTKEQRPGIQATIAGLTTQRNTVERTAAIAAVEDAEKRVDAEQKVRDMIIEITAALQDQQGEFTKAAAARFEVDNRVRRAQLQSNAATPGPLQAASRKGLEELNQTEANVLLKSKLNEVQREQNLLLEAQANAEAKITNQLTASGNSPEAQLRALEQLNALRQASIGPLTQSAEKALVLAKALNDKETVATQERLKTTIGGTAASLTDAAQAAQLFSIAQQRVSRLLQDESISEQHIQNLRTSGALTGLGAIQATDEARRRSLGALTAEADALDAVQGKSADQVQHVRQLRVEIEGLEASSHQLADTFNNVFVSAASSPFADFITGAKSAKEAFADFGKQVEQSLARIATQQLAEQIFGGGGKGGGIGGVIAGLFGAASGGGGGGGAVSYAGAMATGGTFTVGGSGGTDTNMVAFRATRGERVTVTKPGSGSGGGVDVGGVTIIVNNPRDAEDIRRSGTQIAKDVGRKINRELARS